MYTSSISPVYIHPNGFFCCAEGTEMQAPIARSAREIAEHFHLVGMREPHRGPELSEFETHRTPLRAHLAHIDTCAWGCIIFDNHLKHLQVLQYLRRNCKGWRERIQLRACREQRFRIRVLNFSRNFNTTGMVASTSDCAVLSAAYCICRFEISVKSSGVTWTEGNGMTRGR